MQWKNKKLFQTLLALVICIAIILLSSSVSQSITTSDEIKIPQEPFEKIAEAKLAAEGRILVEGLEISALSREDADYASYAQALDPENIALLHRQKDAMALDQSRYTAVHIELTVEKVVGTNLQVVMTASVYTVYDLEVLYNGKIDPLAPTATKEVQDHTFTFKNIKGKWSLIEDHLDNTLGPVKPDLVFPPI